MSSEPPRLLRKPLPPKNLPPIEKIHRAPRISGTVMELLPLCVEETYLRDQKTESSDASSWDIDPPILRVAPPTPEPTETSVPLMPTISTGFPRRPPRTLPKIALLECLHTDPRYIPPPPSFCFNDFLQSRDGIRHEPQSLPGLRKVALSRCNYKKLIRLFLMELHKGQQTEVSTHTMTTEGIPEVRVRIPHRQLLCELAALIHMEVEAQEVTKSRCVEGPSLGSEVEVWVPPGSQQPAHKLDNLYPATEVILSSVTTKHFQGSRRTQSPFQPLGQSISSSELAILDCLTKGGKALSLKAHFVAYLPNLSPLSHSLVHLNLSFNDLSVFPVEVYELTQLEGLKMRDNPIVEVPAGIHRLVHLRTLVLSFCKISSLSSDLYELSRLQYLDVSYNLLSSLSNDIRKLRTLEFLNVEGNQLPALPCGGLRLALTQLKISYNYMHPYFLEGFGKNSPQTLLDLATLALSLTEPSLRYPTLPPQAQQALNRVNVCDCCRGPLYGVGLNVIRPCYEIFGLRRVPFLFNACSPSCLGNFQNQTESLTALLYGDESL